MEQEVHITLRYQLAIGKVNLNEIVYELQKLQNPLMLEILKQILRNYDDLISQRLSTVESNPPSRARKGLGGHVRKNDPNGDVWGTFVHNVLRVAMNVQHEHYILKRLGNIPASIAEKIY